MMNKLINILNKYKLSLFIAFLIVIIGIMGLVFFNIMNTKKNLKTYESDYYLLQYDKGWKLIEKDKDKTLLKYGKEAKLNIEIIELKDDLKYSGIEDLIEEIIYNIEKQNNNYKLISKKNTMFTKYDFKGYKLLYENKNTQVMISLYKKSDKLIMFNYETSNNYFDILLDSVQNIIYNFDVKEKNYDLSNKIIESNTDISYSYDDELDKTFEKTETHEIAVNNYYVKYSIPNSFEISDFESNYNYYNYKGIDRKYITISASIYKYNVIEYLDKENQVNIYKNYMMYKDEDNYSDFKENLVKLNGKIDTYLYKNSYNYDKAIIYDENFKNQKNKRKDENAVLIYALNKNHILTINIKTTGTAITKKLIDSIKIEEVKNYSSYIPVKKENGYILSELKRYDKYNDKKITEIKISIPDYYKEHEYYNDNIYSDRYFGLNYDEDKEIYDYEIHYSLTSSNIKIENEVNIINSLFSKSYGEYNELTYLKNFTKNDKEFKIYSGGYTQLGGIMFTNINRFYYYIYKKVLFYELDTGGYLVIEISGNGKEVTDEVINDVINFQIKKADK